MPQFQSLPSPMHIYRSWNFRPGTSLSFRLIIWKPRHGISKNKIKWAAVTIESWRNNMAQASHLVKNKDCTNLGNTIQDKQVRQADDARRDALDVLDRPEMGTGQEVALLAGLGSVAEVGQQVSSLIEDWISEDRFVEVEIFGGQDAAAIALLVFHICRGSVGQQECNAVEKFATASFAGWTQRTWNKNRNSIF